MPNTEGTGAVAAFAAKVADARYLLDWAISEMPTYLSQGDTPPPDVPKTVIESISIAEKRLADFLAENTAPVASEIAVATSQLDEALIKLSKVTAPVSVQTLRDTEKPPGSERSRARVFYNWLAVASIASLLTVVISEVFLEYVTYFWPTSDAKDAFSDEAYWLILIAERIEPFSYGALGASAFLLYNAKKFVTNRSFDRYRGDEYRGRFLLGVVSGGAAALLVETVVLDDGTTLEISKAVIGFLGGYSTEFLTQLVNRLLEAILPRVSISSARAARQSFFKRTSAPEPFSPEEALKTIDRIMARLETVTDEAEREKLLDLLDSVKSRLGTSQ